MEETKKERNYTALSPLVNLVPVFREEYQEVTPPIRGEDLDGTVSKQITSLVDLSYCIIAPLDASG